MVDKNWIFTVSVRIHAFPNFLWIPGCWPPCVATGIYTFIYRLFVVPAFAVNQTRIFVGDFSKHDFVLKIWGEKYCYNFKPNITNLGPTILTYVGNVFNNYEIIST